MEYEYDPQMEETYRRSLTKLVRKSIDDRFYPFLIVDQNNEQLRHFRDMADYAEANQFQVYFVELHSDPQSCLQKNIHNRSLSDIQQVTFLQKKKLMKIISISNYRFINLGNNYHFVMKYLIFDHYFNQMLLMKCVKIFIFYIICLFICQKVEMDDAPLTTTEQNEIEEEESQVIEISRL
jgi:hypothetical protein